jgi:hypothetical protein
MFWAFGRTIATLCLTSMLRLIKIVSLWFTSVEGKFGLKSVIKNHTGLGLGCKKSPKSVLYYLNVPAMSIIIAKKGVIGI